MADYREYLLWSIKRTEQQTQAAKERVLRPLGITPAQQQALAVIGETDGTTAAEVARRCFVTPPTMTSTVSRLEARGFVVREPHPTHRSLVELRLTTQGRQVVKRAEKVVATLDSRLADGLSAAEVARLQRLLDHIAGNAGAVED